MNKHLVWQATPRIVSGEHGQSGMRTRCPWVCQGVASGIHKVCRGGQIARAEKTCPVLPGIRQFWGDPKALTQLLRIQVNAARRAMRKGLEAANVLHRRSPSCPRSHTGCCDRDGCPTRNLNTCTSVLSHARECYQSAMHARRAGATVQTAQASAHREHCVMQLESREGRGERQRGEETKK